MSKKKANLPPINQNVMKWSDKQSVMITAVNQNEYSYRKNRRNDNIYILTENKELNKKIVLYEMAMKKLEDQLNEEKEKNKNLNIELNSIKEINTKINLKLKNYNSMEDKYKEKKKKIKY